jgi:hypothetical protein
MPTITVCHFTARLFLLVTYKTVRKMQRPKRDTARLLRVFSAVSGDAIAPMIKIIITSRAASGMRRALGHMDFTREPVFLQTRFIKLEAGVTDT